VFLVLAGAKDFGFQGPWSFFKSKQPPDITPTILGLKMIKVNKKVHATTKILRRCTKKSKYQTPTMRQRIEIRAIAENKLTTSQ
jgi:hypothetical protein